MIKLNTKIGKHNLQIEFKTMKDMHKFGGIYGNLPQKCTACQSENIFLSYKNPGGNDYFTLACGDCGADANFGIHNNESKNLYWKNDTMEKYVPPDNNKEQNAPKTTGKAQYPQDDFNNPPDDIVPF